MILHIILYTILGAGLLLFGWRILDLGQKIKEKDEAIKDTVPKHKYEKSLKRIKKFEDLCDYKVGLWSETFRVGATNKPFDIEVLIVDRCEDKSKIKILNVIEKKYRWKDDEERIFYRYDGQWIDSSKIKEVSNSKILTREKRMSKLLDE